MMTMTHARVASIIRHRAQATGDTGRLQWSLFLDSLFAFMVSLVRHLPEALRHLLQRRKGHRGVCVSKEDPEGRAQHASKLAESAALRSVVFTGW